MARVYGRVHIKDTDNAFSGEIIFEPQDLFTEQEGVLFTKSAAYLVLDVHGRFDVELAPGPYFVHLNDAKLEILVPDVEQVTLKELLQERYESNT